jgi:hypothetical protein
VDNVIQLKSGAMVWGDWVEVGAPLTDISLDEVGINADPGGIYLIQFACGESGDVGVKAGNFTEVALYTAYFRGTNTAAMRVRPFSVPAATKLWARAMSKKAGAVKVAIKYR